MNLNKLRYLACGNKKYTISDNLKKMKHGDKDENKDTSSKNLSNNDQDIELAIALSLSEQQKNKRQKTNIEELVNEYDDITTIDDVDTLLKASIMSLGGKKVLPNKGGGDCLFHSLSAHLDIDHQQLREDATEYIKINWDRFKDFALKSDTLEPYESKEEYVKHMSQKGVWGDHLSLLALCELYQTNATIIVVNGVELSEPIKINVGSSKTVLIKFNSEFHYEAIV